MITNSLNVNRVVSFSVYVIVLMTVWQLDPNMGAVDTANNRRKASLQKEIVFYSVKFIPSLGFVITLLLHERQ